VTPNLLPILKREHVVDAGAEGFFHFLAGVTKYLLADHHATGSAQNSAMPGHAEAGVPVTELDPDAMTGQAAAVHGGEYPLLRYCTEVLVRGQDIDRSALRQQLAMLGDCAIVAGGSTKVRAHVHTDTPIQVLQALTAHGTVLEHKVDDMLREYEVAHARKYPIALVTDSVCDLPAALIDQYQIHVVPMNILVGDAQYLDGLTITNDQIYAIMDGNGTYPTTAQPGPTVFSSLYSYLLTYYQSVIAIHVSGKLSGTYGASLKEALRIDGERISVIDSRHDSGSQALIVLRAAELIAAGQSHAAVTEALATFIPKARIYVSVPTLRYMVKGGRVSPLKGALANLLNLKPIVSLDSDGASLLCGKAFSTRRNLQKILALVKEFKGNDPLRYWAIVHASCLDQARDFAGKISQLTGQPPLFIQEISPIIALHAGKGTLAVVLMKE
jgi:hypothetical protein